MAANHRSDVLSGGSDGFEWITTLSAGCHRCCRVGGREPGGTVWTCLPDLSQSVEPVRNCGVRCRRLRRLNRRKPYGESWLPIWSRQCGHRGRRLRPGRQRRDYHDYDSQQQRAKADGAVCWPPHCAVCRQEKSGISLPASLANQSIGGKARCLGNFRRDLSSRRQVPLAEPLGLIWVQMATPTWTDWVTAISTATTAMIAGLAVWFGLLRDKRARLPVVEHDAEWRSLGGEDYICFHVTVRNRLYEMINIRFARVSRPRGATLFDLSMIERDHSNRPARLPRSSSATLIINRDVRPIGDVPSRAADEGPFVASRVDVQFFDIYLRPPPHWSSGRTAIELRISSRASTIRDKRIIIRRRMEAINASNADESARSPA